MFQSATVSGSGGLGGFLFLDAGATLGMAAFALTDEGNLEGTLGTLTNAMTLSGNVSIGADGAIGGSGTLPDQLDAQGYTTPTTVTAGGGNAALTFRTTPA